MSWVAPPAAYEFSPGQDFQTNEARYKVIERLGRGGNSDVYLCQARTGAFKGIFFAVKLMTRIDKEDRLQRFRSELAFLKGVSHPGIMTVIDEGTAVFGPPQSRVEVPFYVSEYLPKTLRDTIRTGLLILDKVSIAYQLAASLAFLAAREPQIVHRDIKPENIFIRGRTPVIGDFGLLKALGSKGVIDAFEIGDLSRGVRHPRLYPTPELVAYAKDESSGICPKSDVFQMGIVFSEMFCDFFPIAERSSPLSPVVVLDRPAVGGNQGRAIAALIAQMLEVDRDRRASAEFVFAELDSVFSEVSSDARKLEGRAFW